ncbi:THAP domain-containing protein 1-like isoform X4 [Pectinophora gossypiella]|uniref:THAP domain-containing protein 1-like isoform X2 n=1 Tax=Pectinophora gossypiella TaxID=13191 RepID=UPI00214F0839|nr:THAP domain-containing protein 1-like isoform X2 [Pectinophora gossypiella]XP_049883485.1 THAP domain-containing protein 1-like isoform X4 [Pectinophora gossypiella]
MSCAVWGCSSHSGRKENSQQLLSFHRFPVDDNKKKEWIIRINRRNWIPNKYSRICSKHFTADSFMCVPNSKWRRLRDDAIPTLNIMDQTDEMNPVTKEEPFDDQSQPQNPVTKEEPFDEQSQPQDCVPMNSEIVPSTSSKISSPEQSQQTSIQNQDCVPMNSEIVPSTSSQISSPKPSHQPSTQNQELLMQVLENEQYKRKIQTLQKQLEKSRKVSKRRLRRINTLTKRVTRLSKKNEDLYSILVEHLKKNNIETEYII